MVVPRHPVLAATTTLVASLAASAEPMLEVQPGTVRPGDAVRVVLHEASGPPEGSIGELPLKFLEHGDTYEAITGLPVELAPGKLEVKVKFPGLADDEEVELTGELDVVEASFRHSELTVSSKYVRPPKSVRARIAQDRAAFARAFAQPLTPRRFKDNFDRPKQGDVTAPFGDLRLFNGKKKSQHFGTDIDGKVGDPVYAANDGKVVLLRDCYASGKTVLVYHGAGVYTAYFHLSGFSVKDGASVRRGQKIGLVGKTGRVTGPHLHWGVKIDGRWVDAESLLRIDFASAGRPSTSQR